MSNVRHAASCVFGPSRFLAGVTFVAPPCFAARLAALLRPRLLASCASAVVVTAPEVRALGLRKKCLSVRV